MDRRIWPAQHDGLNVAKWKLACCRMKQLETIPPFCFQLFPLLLTQRDRFSQTVGPAKRIPLPATQVSASTRRSPTAPRARSICPRITGALKDLVAKPDRRDEKLVLTNSNLMGRERFSERQAAVLNAAARLAEAATLPETDIVRSEQVSNKRLKAKIAREGVTIYPEIDEL